MALSWVVVAQKNGQRITRIERMLASVLSLSSLFALTLRALRSLRLTIFPRRAQYRTL
jgi:hypothetical protein